MILGFLRLAVASWYRWSGLEADFGRCRSNACARSVRHAEGLSEDADGQMIFGSFRKACCEQSISKRVRIEYVPCGI